jgi:hypothetical protein
LLAVNFDRLPAAAFVELIEKSFVSIEEISFEG